MMTPPRDSAGANPGPSRGRRTVLITGASGDIGKGFIDTYGAEFDIVGLDVPGSFGTGEVPGVRMIEADIRDRDSIDAAFAGVDTVVHLAAKRKANTTWDELLATNIVGTYNVFAAAVAHGCRRVVFASSVHAVSGYPASRQLREDDPPFPGDLYGVSKVFGEALGRFVTAEYGLSCIALRIGAFQSPDVARAEDADWLLMEYCAPDDLFEIMHRAITDDHLTFEIFNAVSNNRLNRMDTSKLDSVLGYVPQGDSFSLVPSVRDTFPSLAELFVQPESGMRLDVDGARGKGRPQP